LGPVSLGDSGEGVAGDDGCADSRHFGRD
jgi:hypothetical protein